MQAIEHKLAQVLKFLTTSGEGKFFTDLGEAIRHVQATGESVFINVYDKFNAPQFRGGGMGTDSVNDAGYLLLEKGGTTDYSHSDDYYRQPTALVRLSASINKMRGGGILRPTGHEAIFFRGHGGTHVPLRVFGSLSGTSDYFQIKPFAISK